MKIYSNLISLGSVQDGILLLVSADIPWDLKMLYSTLTGLWVLQFSASLDTMFKCDFLLIFEISCDANLSLISHGLVLVQKIG